MKTHIRLHMSVISAALLLTACASLEHFVSAPEVSLRDVHLESLDLAEQTFLLSFDVSNPNPFPLPIKTISYAVKLDGQRFASGEATSSFTVPAGSDGEFGITVALNLLKTAPDLLFVVRDGVHRDIPYALEGTFGVDIPSAEPLSFESGGLIRLRAAGSLATSR